MRTFRVTVMMVLMSTTFYQAHAADCVAPIEPGAHAFDFLLGQHSVALHAWTPDGWTPPRPVGANWNGWRGLEGAAVYDEWLDPQGGKGVNVRMYDAEKAVWKMMWIATGSLQVQDLRAGFKDGKLTMWQVYPERSGWKAVFTRESTDSWAREEFFENEKGEWVPRFRLVATRSDCG